MKIICEYCGCYVEADENNLCPCCAAPLGESIRAEEERLKKEEAEKAAAEAAKAQEEAEAAAKAEKEQAVIGAITGLASSIGAALTNKPSSSVPAQPPERSPRPAGNPPGSAPHRTDRPGLPKGRNGGRHR